ncbi:NADH-quinone oxidoreductase subunit C [bacterium]|nr:NADH-quinone oxidoreductase subunit C [bacterium]MBU1985333.1 NADH-quinone oxidoreductase subunit C [bacterium]
MTPAEIQQRLKEIAPYSELELEDIRPEAVLRVPAVSLPTVAEHLRRDPSLYFECLKCLSGVDRGSELQVVYHLYSMRNQHHLTLRCSVLKENPTVPSLSRVWPTAEWHEREVYDMLGVRFDGHPDPRRILCPDDWEGHPLRKDYKPPEEYHGIPLTSQFPPESPA